MNVYLVQEDGYAFCVAAKTMTEAINICLSEYLKEMEQEEGDFDKNYETEHYYNSVLESCSLVERLINFPKGKK